VKALHRDRHALAWIVLPYSAMVRWFGFVAPPALFFVYLISATAAYLALVEITKAFFHRSAARR
jgi:Mg2+-importing ATPase